MRVTPGKLLVDGEQDFLVLQPVAGSDLNDLYGLSHPKRSNRILDA